MPSKRSSKKQTELSRMETDIEKGLKKKIVQNLVLAKILNQVDPDRQEQQEQSGGRKTKNESSKY
jgi:hypothetical protein